MNYYEEKVLSENVFVRIFESDVDYPWHRDAEARTIEVLSTGENWSFQEDNKLPVLLVEGAVLNIEKQIFHWKNLRNQRNICFSIGFVGFSVQNLCFP